MKLTVNASKSYDIYIENDFSKIEEQVKKVTSGKKILVVMDSKVDFFYNRKKYFVNYDVYFYVFPAGENSKNADTLFAILKQLSDNCFTRSDTVVAFGGGVVGDVAAFAASIYMRGINLISVPTTLLSSIDSSIGGKTAIDFNGFKNNIGSFYQPSFVYINTSLLKTLSLDQIASGLGEAVKYAFLSKTIAPNLLKLESDDDVNSLIYKCLEIKKAIVEEDEFDTNKRFLLNLGHTIGHSIESLSNYTIPHGICVVKGLKAVIEISAKYYNLLDGTKNEMLALLNEVGTDSSNPYTKGEIIMNLTHDKKANSDGVNFVLLKGIAEPQIQFLTFDEIGQLL